MSPFPRDQLSQRVDVLVEQAQSGGAREALIEVDRALEAGGDDQPGLHYAKAVALHALGEHTAAAGAAGTGVEVATAAGRDGWRSALLAMRALQVLEAVDTGWVVTQIDLEDGSAVFDEGAIVRDLAEAQVAMALGTTDVWERVCAHCVLAEAYTRLRLYELAVPMYLGSYLASDAPLLAPEAPVVQQLNLSTLHLTWAAELGRVGLVKEAGEHVRQAGEHARLAQRVAAGDHAELWAARGRVFASCAASQGPDPVAGVRACDAALEVLPAGEDGFERALTAPFLALALRRAGRVGEGLDRVEAALEALPPDADPLVAAATRYAHLVLLADTDPGARAGLAYGEVLSVSLWRQRARRLSAAEEVLRYERLRSEHEEVARSSEVDVLTGTATRRSFDRRVAALEARRRDHGTPVCVVVVDVDGLKGINDGSGHLAGDEVLKATGQALTACTRGGDLVARFGGDEFVALLSAEAASGVAVAERMLAAVRAQEPVGGLSSPVTVSIGVALTGADRSLSATLEAADRAMYVAKRSGGDAVVAEPQDE